MASVLTCSIAITVCIVGEMSAGILRPNAGSVSFQPAEITFPRQIVGTVSASRPVAIVNDSGARVMISGISTTGEFIQSNDCGTSIPAHSRCNAHLSFAPTVPDLRRGYFQIYDSADGSPHRLGLSGTGVTADLTGEFTISGEEAGETEHRASEGARLTFTGKEGSPLASFAWDFGDGTGGAGRVIVHSYAVSAQYTAALTVTLPSGASAKTSRIVRIHPLVPRDRAAARTPDWLSATTDANGIASFAFDNHSPIKIQARDADSGQALSGLSAFLARDPFGSALVVLRDPSALYHTTFYPLVSGVSGALPAGDLFLGTEDLTPPLPIDVSKPIQGDQSNPQSLTVNAVPAPPPGSSPAASPFEPLFDWSLFKLAALRGALGDVGVQIVERDVSLLELQNEVKDQLAEYLLSQATDKVRNLFLHFVAPVLEKPVENGQLVFGIDIPGPQLLDPLNDMIANGFYGCRGYSPSQMFRVRSVKLPRVGFIKLDRDEFILSITPLEEPSGAPCLSSPVSLQGRVVEADTGAGIAGAMVMAEGPKGRVVFSSGNGGFTIPQLPQGRYLLHADKRDYLGTSTIIQLSTVSPAVILPLQAIRIGSIAVSPASTSPVAIRDVLHFTALARDRNGRLMAPQPRFFWVSEDPGIVDLDQSGMATALSPGFATIKAWSEQGVTSNLVRIEVKRDLATFYLFVGLTGSGTGSVSSQPPGITCGNDCSEGYPQNTPVSLIATADPGSVFKGWSDPCSGTGGCTVVMNVDHAVTAQFDTVSASSHTLSVTVTGNGIVTSTPAGVACGGACSVSYPAGSTVSLVASPGTGSTFTGWGGACGGNGACTVKLDTDLSVSAAFNPASGAPIILSFSANPGTISVGQSSTLSWTTANASGVSISGIVGSQPVNGSTSVSPAATTTYTLTAMGAGGTANALATVTVSSGSSVFAGPFSGSGPFTDSRCTFQVSLMGNITITLAQVGSTVQGSAHLSGNYTSTAAGVNCNSSAGPVDGTLPVSGTPSNLSFAGGVSGFTVSFQGMQSGSTITGTATFTAAGNTGSISMFVTLTRQP